MNIYKIKIPKQILILLIFAIVLNIIRIFIFQNTTFVYMFWNIFLASIPFLISSILIICVNKSNIFKPLFILGFILWIIFLPNAFYVITDFIHLGRIHGVPVMYDIFVLSSSSFVSLLMGIYSIIYIEKILLLKFTKKITDIIIIFVILFSSIGIYLGRFLRYNSWDFFISHQSLLSSIWGIFTKVNDDISVYYYIILFFSYIYISYIVFRMKD